MKLWNVCEDCFSLSSFVESQMGSDMWLVVMGEITPIKAINIELLSSF